jgi:NAD(P)-dependent dehydrogenase (short-subunit alcohol dehydrogenase family)
MTIRGTGLTQRGRRKVERETMRPLAEQVILVTGATDGLGRSLATELAGSGATVLLHGRDEERGREALAAIERDTGNGKLEWHHADFASLEEVREMAARIERDQDRLDALVNNAGIGVTLPGGGARMESRDGYELRFQVNYLAQFLITGRLQALIERSAPARIVSVSSAGQAPIDFDDVMLERDYNGVQAYSQSKLAQVMLTFDLAEELDPTRVTANCLHPATFMPTKMVTHSGISPASSLEEGTRATARLVVDPGLDGVSGRYFDGLSEARAQPQAYDPDARRRLRELSERLVGNRPPS